MTTRLLELGKRPRAKRLEARRPPPRASDLILRMAAIVLVVGAIGRLLADLPSAG